MNNSEPDPIKLRLRERTFRDQKGICYYCHKPILFYRWTLDHRIPVSRGGKGIHGNKVGSCNSCNYKKGNMTEEEFKQCKNRGEMKRKLTQLQRHEKIREPNFGIGT